MSNIKRYFREAANGAKHCVKTMFHPNVGFDAMKWEKQDNIAFCFVILALFFFVNIADQVVTGFIFNTYNPDRISVPSIFLISMGGVALFFIANWSVSSLQFTEGKTKEIFMVTCYSLLPYTVFEFIYIAVTNFSNNDMIAFMTAIRIIGLAWSFIILLVGMLYTHQLSFGGTILNLILTVVGILIILFLILLGYTLVQQIYVFFYTIFNEMAFRK
ncbi:MAG: YIP1 family protein [Clostridia bacterium]|nr:YIP1 family protein [Clostridia bacterium]